MSSLAYELEQLGFLCGIEQELYIQNTGKYTSLIVEGEKRAGEKYYTYDFYKQTFYPRYPNKITVYGEHMTASMLLDRVERYLINRKIYLLERRAKT